MTSAISKALYMLDKLARESEMEHSCANCAEYVAQCTFCGGTSDHTDTPIDHYNSCFLEEAKEVLSRIEGYEKYQRGKLSGHTKITNVGPYKITIHVADLGEECVPDS